MLAGSAEPTAMTAQGAAAGRPDDPRVAWAPPSEVIAPISRDGAAEAAHLLVKSATEGPGSRERDPGLRLGAV